MDVIETVSFRGGSKRGCPGCGYPPVYSFNWHLAEKEGDCLRSEYGPELHIRVKVLRFERALKWGRLHFCKICSERWFLDDEGLFITHVPQARRTILDCWDKTQLVPLEEHIENLRSIGGTGADQYGNHADEIRVPCKLTKASGECFDPAIVVVARKPPIDDRFDRVALYDDVACIEPSEYALPLVVRVAALYAPELRMGFAPTRVESEDGNRFVLNWSQSVFFHDGITATQIRLSKEKWNVYEEESVHSDAELATFVFADWFPYAERLDRGIRRPE